MPERNRVTLKDQVAELKAELKSLHTVLGVILAGVGGSLVLSKEQIEGLVLEDVGIVAFDIQDSDAFLLRMVDKYGNDWANGTAVPAGNEDAPVA